MKKVFFSLALLCFIAGIAYSIRVYNLYATAPLGLEQVTTLIGLVLTAGVFFLGGVSLSDKKHYGDTSAMLIFSSVALMLIYGLTFYAAFKKSSNMPMHWIDGIIMICLTVFAIVFCITGLVLKHIKDEYEQMQVILDHFHQMENVYAAYESNKENKSLRGDYVTMYFRFIDIVCEYMNEKHKQRSKNKVENMFNLAEGWAKNIVI